MRLNPGIMRRWFLALACMASCLCVSAQSLDSLISAYRKTDDPEVKLDLLMRLAWTYENNQAYTKALEYYQEALKLKNSSTIPAEAELTILKHLAYCYAETGDHRQETRVYENILGLYRQSNNLPEINKSLQLLSGLYIKSGNLAKAALYNEEMLRIAEQENNYVGVAVACNNLGVIYNGLKQEKISTGYFTKAYALVSEQTLPLNDDNRATILTNLGVANASLGKLSEAQRFLEEALAIRQRDNDTLMIAQALNFLGTYDYISNRPDNAHARVSHAIGLLQRAPQSEARHNTLASSYKLMAEIMLKKKDVTGFKKFTDQYNQLQLAMIEQERKRNNRLMEHQIDVERKENEVTRLLAEKEKQEYRLRQTEMEHEAREHELKLQASELIRLRQENELQQAYVHNQQLEKEKMKQTLELMQQKAAATEQQQKMDLLQKDQEMQKLLLDKRNGEILQLEKDKIQNARITTYGAIIIILLVMLLLVIGFLFWHRNRKNKMLAEQSRLIGEMNHEITMQNEELVTVNDQLHLKTEALSERNEKLVEAQSIIHEQNTKLLSYNKNLEEDVRKRTAELTASNEQLQHYTTQLEQFTYALSHNIRAPLARLLGLSDLIQKTGNEAERSFILQKLKESALDLDDVIRDLNKIISLKNQENLKVEEVELSSVIDKSLTKLNDLIETSHPSIDIDLSNAPKLYSVSGYLENIFYNLISNALKYRCPDRECRIQIRSLQEGDHVLLTVSDNGLGIDLNQHKEKLFGLYKRFHPFIEGKGLGLYFVKTQIEAMHGKIEVDSATNRGTTFRIHLATNSVAA